MPKTPRFLILLCNPGGELDRRTAETEAECKEAVLDMATSLEHFAGGDTIRITDHEDN